MTEKTETEETTGVAVKTVAAWKKRAVHEVTLPSATTVKIALPNLPALLKTGNIPNELMEIAVKQEAAGPNQDVQIEDVEALADFYRYLVSTTVVEPKIEREDVDTLPYEDVDMIVQFATRQRDTDALGHHLAGLERTEEWRKFRDDEFELARLLSGQG